MNLRSYWPTAHTNIYMYKMVRSLYPQTFAQESVTCIRLSVLEGSPAESGIGSRLLLCQRLLRAVGPTQLSPAQCVGYSLSKPIT